MTKSAPLIGLDIPAAPGWGAGRFAKVLFILGIFFLCSQSYGSSEARECNAGERLVTDDISALVYDYYIESSYVGSGDDIKVEASSCQFDKGEYTILNHVEWQGGWTSFVDYWIDAKLTLKPNDNQSDNPYTIEKTDSSVTEKGLPSRKTAIITGISAAVVVAIAGVTTWAILDPIGFGSFVILLKAKVSATLPDILSSVGLTNVSNLKSLLQEVVPALSAVVKEVVDSSDVPDDVAEFLTPENIEQAVKKGVVDGVGDLAQKPDLTLLFQQLIAEQDKWYNSVFESYGKIIMGTLILMLLFLGVMFLKKRK